jgi:Xaa-Pro aminopeptidase
MTVSNTEKTLKLVSMKNSEFDQRLKALKEKLKDQKIDFFFLPNSDEFFLEYLPESEKRIEYLTGFSGSNASIIFGERKSQFFTDGRYILQAKNQLNLNEFEVLNIAEKSIFLWLEENLKKGQKLAFDGKLQSLNFIKTCQKIAEKNSAELVFPENNPVDKIWQNRPKVKNSPLFFCDEKISGENSWAKRKRVLENLESDAVIITKPENLCWLLNLRASDVEFNPLFLAYGILFKNGEVELFIDEKRLSNLPSQALKKITAIQPDCFDLRIAVLRKTINKIQIDATSTNYWLYQVLEKNNFEIIFKNDVIEILKSCKNEIEIFGAKKSHEIDGLAVTRFLFWLEKSLKNGEEIDEISAEEKLLEFRKKHPAFLYPSFATISSFASNGAIIHYHASKETNKKISGDSLFLIDSGGQYFGKNFCGTTDITRTIAVGKPNAEMIEDFTRVLKGHIALARAKFPIGSNGATLDVLARFHLWQVKKDYDHGTGHGVGSFLSVHEGPCSISRRGQQALLPNMILSNEPGFYAEGKYGIRIENLMLVEKCDEKFLQFKTLTLVPIDMNLIDFSMLTRPEKQWLYDYHQLVFEKLKDGLDEEEKLWLRKIAEIYKMI